MIITYDCRYPVEPLPLASTSVSTDQLQSVSSSSTDLLTHNHGNTAVSSADTRHAAAASQPSSAAAVTELEQEDVS